MAHRLLKNNAAAVVDGAYALISDAAANRFEVPRDDAVLLVENYEHYAPVQAYVFQL